MKLTPDQLQQILQQQPIHWTGEETTALLSLMGLTAKEYVYHADKEGSRSTRRFEVHHKRLYLFKVKIDTSRSISISNQYINFGEGLSGISFGGMETVKDVLHIILTTASQIDSAYSGTINFDADKSEYTEVEFLNLIGHLNHLIFQNT